MFKSGAAESLATPCGDCLYTGLVMAQYQSRNVLHWPALLVQVWNWIMCVRWHTCTLVMRQHVPLKQLIRCSSSLVSEVNPCKPLRESQRKYPTHPQHTHTHSHTGHWTVRAGQAVILGQPGWADHVISRVESYWVSRQFTVFGLLVLWFSLREKKQIERERKGDRGQQVAFCFCPVYCWWVVTQCNTSGG